MVPIYAEWTLLPQLFEQVLHVKEEVSGFFFLFFVFYHYFIIIITVLVSQTTWL